MPKRILVIGGTRFIGPYVVRELVDHGHSVTVFHRGKTRSPNLPRVPEICSEQAAIPIRSLPPEVARLTVDVVIHMVPMGRDDARAAATAFAGRAGRIVMISSCDVYLAYGRFRRSEPGDPVPTPLTEQSALRSVHFPYRTQDTPRDAYEYDYEKILMEEEVKNRAHLPAVVLRLPKVYGREDNADLATVYGATNFPTWRWTHAYVENVAHAIALGAVHPRASDQVFNVGEATTPTVAERLAYLPARPPSIKELTGYDFRQDMSVDTSKIRAELGYAELFDETAKMQEIASGVR